MKSQKYTVHPILGEHISCLWSSEHVAPSSGFLIDLLPDSYIELVFSFGGSAQVEFAETIRPLPRCYLVGLLNRPCCLRVEGMLRSVAARFYAWGFHSLLGRDTNGSLNTVSGLSAEWQRIADRLEPVVLSDDIESAIDILHTYLIERALPIHFEHSVIQSAAQRLIEKQGRVSVENLADYCQLSRRQLERLFNASLGESPKALARLARFEQARDRLWHDPNIDLASLSRECGYSDQAHLSREFKRFSHRTPRQFTNEMLATYNLVRSAGVAFLQDN